MFKGVVLMRSLYFTLVISIIFLSGCSLSLSQDDPTAFNNDVNKYVGANNVFTKDYSNENTSSLSDDFAKLQNIVPTLSSDKDTYAKGNKPNPAILSDMNNLLIDAQTALGYEQQMLNNATSHNYIDIWGGERKK